MDASIDTPQTPRRPNQGDGAATAGARLRALRRARDMRPATLARAAGIIATRLARLEKGYARPRPDELVALARALGVDPVELGAGRPLSTPPGPAHRPEPAMPPEAAVAVDLLGEAVRHGNFAAARPMLAPRFALGRPPGDGRVTAGALADFLARLRRACPDLDVAVDEVAADGDTVTFRWTLTGRHTGSVGGVPATGAAVRCAGAARLAVEGGRLAGGSLTLDEGEGQLRAIGVLPAS